MFRRWAGPNAAGVVMFAVALAATAVTISPSITDWPLLEKDLPPLRALGWIAAGWMALMPLGRLMTPIDRSKRWAPWIVLSVSALLGIALMFAIATGVSRYYWGYFLAPPGVDARVLDARSVTSLTYFLKNPDVRDGFHQLAGWTIDEVRQASVLPVPVATTEGASTSRGMAEVARRGVLQNVPTTLPSDRMADVFQTMRDTGLLEVEGVEGHVLEFTGGNGTPYLFVAARGEPGMGGAISNDHYPFYEFLFTVPAGERSPRQLLSFTRFYWDSAGMEELTWWRMFLLFAPFVVALAMLPTGVYLLFSRLRDDRSRLQRGFAVERAAVLTQDE